MAKVKECWFLFYFFLTNSFVTNKKSLIDIDITFGLIYRILNRYAHGLVYKGIIWFLMYMKKRRELTAILVIFFSFNQKKKTVIKLGQFGFIRIRKKYYRSIFWLSLSVFWFFCFYTIFLLQWQLMEKFCRIG